MGNYTFNTTASTTADITPLQITGSFTAQNKVYDGTTLATIATRSLSGVLGTDVVSLTGGTAAFVDKNVGDGKTVNGTGFSLSGADAGNYTLASASLTATGNITQRALTVSATGVNKVYDGTTSATVTLSDNRVSGDVLALSYSSASFASPYVGPSKPVTVSGISVAGTDAGNYTHNTTTSTTASITPLGVTTVVSVSPGSQQYSDLVTFTASVNPIVVGDRQAATEVDFYVGTQKVGSCILPAASGTCSNPIPLLEPTPFGTSPTGQMAPGGHTVTAVFNGVDPNFIVVNPTADLTITKEDARVTYTGSLFVNTASATSSVATVTLSATIQDITAAADAAGDTYPGDIRNATVMFVNRDTNTPICTPTIGLVNPSDTKTGVASCVWEANIGSADSVPFTIGIVVNNYYTRDSSEDNEVITISKPLSTNFITGGGYLVLATSAGQMAGNPGSKNNFGFNVKYNKSGKNLQGNMNIIFRRTEPADGNKLHVYQIKANAMDTLGVDPANGCTTGTPTKPCFAAFTSKANLKDITNPLAPISIGGNSQLQVTITDKGEPGRLDTIGITYFSDAGGIRFSSSWTGTATGEQPIGGGNLVVH